MYRFVIDGEKITKKADIYQSIAEQIPLPGWFGKNLDALYDVITCDLLPKDKAEAEVVHLKALRENLGSYADALAAMLSDIASGDQRFGLKINE